MITLKIKTAGLKISSWGLGAGQRYQSMVTELVKGLTLEEALEVSNKHVAEALGGLPPQKLHCSNLAADAVRAAIKDYYEKQGIGTDIEIDEDHHHDRGHEEEENIAHNE